MLIGRTSGYQPAKNRRIRPLFNHNHQISRGFPCRHSRRPPHRGRDVISYFRPAFVEVRKEPKMTHRKAFGRILVVRRFASLTTGWASCYGRPRATTPVELSLFWAVPISGEHNVRDIFGVAVAEPRQLQKGPLRTRFGGWGSDWLIDWLIDYFLYRPSPAKGH